jgi:hypothetical protein
MESKKYYTIYKITCTINNKIYIGQHSTNDLNDTYFGSGALLKEDVDLFGKEKFIKEILYVFDTWEECDKKENQIVNADFVARDDTYNCRHGGYSINENKKFNYSKAGKLGQEKLKQRFKDDPELRKEINEKLRIKSSLNNNARFLKENSYDWTGKKHKEESKKKIGKANAIHQQGTGNSNFGNCWIYNKDLKENKLISKTDLDIWLKQNWIKGRKMSF